MAQSVVSGQSTKSTKKLCAIARDKGFVYASKDQYNEALESFDKAIFWDCFSVPGNEARLAKGFLLIKLGRAKEGIKDLQWYLTTEEDNEQQRNSVIDYIKQQEKTPNKLSLMHKFFPKAPYLFSLSGLNNNSPAKVFIWLRTSLFLLAVLLLVGISLALL